MPKFSYTAINPERQTLNGIIDASNESNAREKLNKMEFSVIDLTLLSEIEEKKLASAGIVYEFEAIDRNGKKVKGTIEAENKYAAFKRLIKEYHLEIASLCKSAASEEEKEAEKEKGVIDFYSQFKKEEAEVSKKTPTAKTLEEKETQSKYISEEIDFVVQKVDELTKNFADILKPEEYENISRKRDKLLRMKTSANIAYVESLCEELLAYIQSQEIYVAQKANDERVQTFNIAIKTKLSDIQRSKLGETFKQQVLDSILKWRSENIESVQRPTLLNKILNKIFETVEQILEEDPRITEVKTKLRIINQKIRDYNKIYRKEVSGGTAEEMQNTIKNLLLEKEKIIQELKDLKKNIKLERTDVEKISLLNRIIEELASLSGYLLAFYLIFYLTAEYLITKNIINSNHYIFLVQRSIQFHYIVAILFTANIILVIRKMFLRNLAGVIISIPLILILSALIIANF